MHNRQYHHIITALILCIFLTLPAVSAIAQNKPQPSPNKAGGVTTAVLFNKNKFPSWDTVYNKFLKRWKNPNEVKRNKIGKDKGLSFTVGKTIVSVSASHGPILQKYMKEASVGTWWWRSAAKEVRSHTGFIFAAYIPLDKNHLKTHRIMTVVTSIILEEKNAFAVHHVSSELLMPKPLYLSEASRMSESYLPMMLWVKTYVGQGKTPNGKTAMFGRTVGMRNFGLMEMETRTGPTNIQLLHKLLWGMQSYLAQKGPVIADGHTMGRTNAEKIKILHKKSVFGSNKKVYFLVFP